MTRLEEMSHSGAIIKKISDTSEVLIEKRFINVTDRDVRSIGKQERFGSDGISRVIKTPSVKSKIAAGNDLIVRMEFAPGLVGPEIIQRCGLRDSLRLRNSLEATLNWGLNCSRDSEVNASVFIQKIESLDLPTSFCNHRESIKRSVLGKSSIVLPVGLCHGDLTLSNLIVGSKEIFLIDFLDSYLESPLQDVAKLYQDLHFGWSTRGNKNLSVRASILGMKLMPKLGLSLRRKYAEAFEIILGLTLLRIAPYLKDNTTESWLLHALEKYEKGEY